MPVVVVLVLGVLQVALVARDQLALESVARDAARAAAVSAAPEDAARAAAARLSSGVHVDVALTAELVTVTARAPPARVPLIGAAAPDELVARATMPREPP